MADGETPATARDVIVLGAGIGGLAAADHLNRAGYRVTVLERSNRCGGAHKSYNIGPYTFDVGSIFYEPRAQIFNMAQDLRALCPAVMRRQRRVAQDGRLLHYPVEPRDMLRSNPWRAALGVADMLSNQLVLQRDGTLETICRKRLGDTFFDNTGLRAYITRFHHAAPAEIDEQFYFQRMKFIEKATRLKSIMARGARSVFTKKAVNARMLKPLHIRPQSGFDTLFAPIQQRLEKAGVRFVFGQDVQRVSQTSEGFDIETDAGRHHTDSLVSTIPLTQLYRAMFGKYPALTLLDMTTLFVSAQRLDPQSGNVLFNFHNDGLWKRATVYSQLYPGADTDRAFMGVEVTIPHGGTHDPERTFADFRDHLTGLGIASDIKLEGSALVEGCYPFLAKGTDALLAAALKRISAAGVIVAGRQGRFEYLPTSSRVITRVGEELERATTLQMLRADPHVASH